MELKLKDATSYRCYRQFLLDCIKLNELSYRSFSAKYRPYIGLQFLSKLLKRDDDGHFTKEANLRQEKLAALLAAMGVDRQGIAHLVLCRLDNDKIVGSYEHAKAFSKTLRSFQGDVNSSYLKIVEALENLLPNRRRKVINTLKAQLTVEIERTHSSLKADKLRQIQEAL